MKAEPSRIISDFDPTPGLEGIVTNAKRYMLKDEVGDDRIDGVSGVTSSTPEVVTPMTIHGKIFAGEVALPLPDSSAST